MAGIFINYRRDDAAGFARSVYEHLDQQFKQGQVFMDVEALREPGMDFVHEIDRSLSRCAVMVVLIGKAWAGSANAAGRRRLDDPDDFVRLEIATALKRDVRVMPVLLNGAAMPSVEELPADLQLLGRRQAIALTHDDWTHDVSRLVDAIGKVPGIRKRSARRQGWSTRSLIVAGSLGAALGLGLLVWAGFKIEDQRADTKLDASTVKMAEKQDFGTYTPEPAVQSQPEAPPAAVATQAAPAQVPSPSRDDTYRAQVLLASLGYDPGVVDGVYGRATINAISAFQRDNGYAVTGGIDGQLLDQLQTITQSRSTQTAATPPPVSEEPASYTEEESRAAFQAAAAAMPSVPDVSGTWYDNNGLAAQLMQDGESVTVAAINPATGMPQIIGQGSVQGRFVTIRYQNFAGVPGLVQAELTPDGMHMSGSDTNALLNVPVPNTWHRNHLPGD